MVLVFIKAPSRSSLSGGSRGQCELSGSREDGADEKEVRVGVRRDVQSGYEDILGLVQVGGNGRLRRQGCLTQPDNIFLNPTLRSPSIHLTVRKSA